MRRRPLSVPGILFTIAHEYAKEAGHRLAQVEREGVGRAAGWVGSVVGPVALLAAGAGLLAAGAGLLAGCGSAAAAGAGPGASCGTTHTAANVPVVIKVAKGTVNCGTALQV